MAAPSDQFSDALTSLQRCCAWCGLPVSADRPRAGRETPNREAQPVYCCYGCRFAHEVVREGQTAGETRWTIVRLGLAIFFTMNLMAFTMTMWSLDVYDVQPDPFQLKLYEVFRWLSMLFALPVLLLLGVPLLTNAVFLWQLRVPSTDLLIGVAVTAAYVTSAVNVVVGSGPIWFEVGAMVLVMVTLGRWLEAAGKQRATAALDELSALLPQTVHRVRPDRVGEDEIDAAEISVGDLLRVRPGEQFAVDGVIERGRTSVDEQIFTGESVPVPKAPGDHLLAGTTNLDGDVWLRATARFREGAFGRLLKILQDARMSRGRYQLLAERMAFWFVPLVSVAAVLAFFLHVELGVGAAVQTSLSVLLIACPCALGLATPLAVWASLATAVRHHVLFRSGEAIERLADVQAVCFDKTGTLTSGQPRVTQMATFNGDLPAERLMVMVDRLASASSHPFSKAIHRYCAAGLAAGGAEGAADDTQNGEEFRFLSVRSVPGKGMQAELPDGAILRLGSLAFACCAVHHDSCLESEIAEAAVPASRTPEGLLNSTESSDCEAASRSTASRPDSCVSCDADVCLGGRVKLDRLRMAADQQKASVVLVSIDGIPVAGFLLTEELRPDASRVLQTLTGKGLAVAVLTGDRKSKARLLRELLKMPRLQVLCQLSPEQKVEAVKAMQREYGSTAMVGDGINDAPALAASDVGIAMGCGADVSRDSADVCLLRDDLAGVVWSIRNARRTRSVIRQNLAWAFGYNSVGVTVAVAGKLNPAFAAALMIASSLLVISNSLRLLNSERDDDGGPVSQRAADSGKPTAGKLRQVSSGSDPLRVANEQDASAAPTTMINAEREVTR